MRAIQAQDCLITSYASLPTVIMAHCYLIAALIRPSLAALLRRLEMRAPRSFDEIERARFSLPLIAILRIARRVVVVTMDELHEDDWDEIVLALGDCKDLRALGVGACGALSGDRSMDVLWAHRAPWIALDRVNPDGLNFSEAPGPEHWAGRGLGPALRSICLENCLVSADFLEGFTAACSRLHALRITCSLGFDRASLLRAVVRLGETLRRLELFAIAMSPLIAGEAHVASAGVFARLDHFGLDCDMLSTNEWINLPMENQISLRARRA